ncbi:MAG: hypothetical protein HS113_29785 [Verrucomicrobiales bacterium]|nr:hypothetical protein [Verrucomicrobiales bacterium]
MNFVTRRRQFLATAAVTSSFSLVPRHVLGGAGQVAPNDKITLAHIGMGTQGFSELGGQRSKPPDPDRRRLRPQPRQPDYIERGAQHS